MISILVQYKSSTVAGMTDISDEMILKSSNGEVVNPTEYIESESGLEKSRIRKFSGIYLRKIWERSVQTRLRRWDILFCQSRSSISSIPVGKNRCLQKNLE